MQLPVSNRPVFQYDDSCWDLFSQCMPPGSMHAKLCMLTVAHITSIFQFLWCSAVVQDDAYS